MALKAVVEKIEDVDAKYADLYEEKDDKFVLKPIEGLKPVAEFEVMSNSLKAERDAHKTTKKKWEPISTLDPKAVREQLDKIPELEALAEGKLDEAKIETVVNSRVKAKLAPVERDRDQFKAKADELSGELETFKTEKRVRSLHDTIRIAAKAAKITETAMDDALLLGERVLEIGDDGNAVVKADSGYTPGITPDQWFQDLLGKKPHWWGESSGGGARPKQGGAFADNPFTHAGWNLTKQGEMVKADRAKADRYAQQAGTTVGGRRPEAKK